MQSEIIVGLLSLCGTCVGSWSGMRLISYRIEQLEKKVEKHNNFAERMPVVENDIKTLYHKFDDLEHEIR